jgi:demethylmenaquinone methyltransferase/2-methoxy-6-polyprenyl-1,4-benzoquinol methylase
VDLDKLRTFVAEALAGHRVLELACGTGYWTAIAARTAQTVVATDRSSRALDVARSRRLPSNVRFARLDAFDVAAVPRSFTAVFAAFWWSHIPRARITAFLTELTRCFASGSSAVFLDNRYVEGSSTPIARVDDQGDTYQLRRMRDGSSVEVLKNFPSTAELLTVLAPVARDRDVEVARLQYYWHMRFRFGAA